MKGIFIELPAFERHRARYLDDDGYRKLQDSMMEDPIAGDLIEGTGGLRKLRYADPRRGKGKRGGLRVIYFYWSDGSMDGTEFWLVTLYDKGEGSDLTPRQRVALKEIVKTELKARHRL
jgi:hypothetical protein